MLFLPILAIILFCLVLGLKLLGGAIAWWIVITFGIIILVPIFLLLIIDFISRFKAKN